MASRRIFALCIFCHKLALTGAGPESTFAVNLTVPEAWPIDHWQPCAEEFTMHDVQLAHKLKGKMIRGVLRMLERDEPLIYIDSMRFAADLFIRSALRPLSPKTREYTAAQVLKNLTMTPWKHTPIVHLPPDQICQLEDALRMKEMANVTPFALLSPGNDGHGCPFRRYPHRPDDTYLCAYRLLNDTRIVRYFSSHVKFEKLHPKMAFIPLGFGHRSSGNESHMRKYLSGLLAAVANNGVQSRVRHLFLMINAENPLTPRPAIMRAIRKSLPHVRNLYPLSPSDFRNAAAHSMFSLSPEGTAPDGWRHYQFLLMGSATNVPDTPSMRAMLENSGMPVWFGGYCGNQTDQPKNCTNTLSCRLLREKVLALSKQHEFNYDALTAKYWVDFMRTESALVQHDRIRRTENVHERLVNGLAHGPQM